MPQRVDPLSRRLPGTFCQDLRDFLAHYEVEIVSCQFWRNRPPWSVEWRRCPDTFLLFPVCGRVKATLAGASVRIDPGSYLALADQLPHALQLERGYARLEQISVHCRIHDRRGRPLLSRLRCLVAALAGAPRWHRDLMDLAALMQIDPATGRQHGCVLVQELIAARLRAGERLAPLKHGGDPRIERILARMQEDAASPLLSIEALAREVQLTATQMRKLFRRETHCGPKEYLQQLRLRRAAQLLRHSMKTIKEIAFECGFATDNYFHLVFRQAYGTTPAGYRDREML